MRYRLVTHSLGCMPTFPLTAMTLRRHPSAIRALCEQGVEFAVHGYIHTDYGVMPLEEQSKHFRKAIDVFRAYRVPFTGFRAPYLRTNAQTPRALGGLQFAYDSSYVLHWDVIERAKYPERSRNTYDQLLDFYASRKAEEHLALPKFLDGFVDIRVSLPDDEMIVDRLGITSTEEMSHIWSAILRRTYLRGELFTLSLHPERISLCESALADTLEQIKPLDPPVWIATLSQIADWWKERAKYKLHLTSEGRDTYRVQADCSDRGTSLVKNCKVSVPTKEWADGYRTVAARNFVLESRRRPAIGVGLDSSPDAVAFLKSEGFLVERSARSETYGIYLDGLARFTDADQKRLVELIEHSDAPLVRYWRWPSNAKSALSVTGDIDSMTIGDFVLRLFENWRAHRSQKLSIRPGARAGAPTGSAIQDGEHWSPRPTDLP